MKSHVILASSSPRRQELLRQVGIDFSIRLSEVDETKITIDDPVERVETLALLKGRNVSFKFNGEIILSADTIVSYNNRTFEKPTTEKEAYEMISTLSGNTHEVYTGVAIRSKKYEKVFVEKTTVEFWPINEEEIRQYIQTKEPYDKAGAYGIQSSGALFVKRIIGDYYNVVGLPISRVARELKEFQA